MKVTTCPLYFPSKKCFSPKEKTLSLFLLAKKVFALLSTNPGFPMNFVPSLNLLGEQYFSSRRSARFLWKGSPACNHERSRPEGGGIKLPRKNRETGKK